MELNSKSMGGEGARPLFWGGGTELADSFEPCRGARDCDEDEFCEELEPDREPESTPAATNCLAGEVLALARLEDCRGTVSGLLPWRKSSSPSSW